MKPFVKYAQYVNLLRGMKGFQDKNLLIIAENVKWIFVKHIYTSF